MDQEQNTSEASPAPVQPHIQRPQSTLGVPIAIVIAALVIAGAIIYTDMGKTMLHKPTDEKAANEQVTRETVVAPVTDADHIRGNPNAPIVIVEYSDFDCPFCKNFHETMKRIMDDYGKNGKVAWVYRQFPLEQLHPNAPLIAEASECVAAIGGDEAFWKFADLVFGERAVNAPTNMTALPGFAERSGVSKQKFDECIKNSTYKEKVKTAIQDAVKAGAQGTPHSILIVGDQKGEINGAQPYETVKRMIDTMLQQVEGGA